MYDAEKLRKLNEVITETLKDLSLLSYYLGSNDTLSVVDPNLIKELTHQLKKLEKEIIEERRKLQQTETFKLFD